MPKRRDVLMGAGAALLAAGGARAAGTPETRTVEIAGVRDPQLGAQLAIAQQYGYFKDAGLDVTIHWNQSAADTLTSMASGINVGVGGIFTQVVFSGQKLPVRTISALADIAETQGFALGPNVKLGSPKELEGKKLAYTQGNSQILLIAKLAKMYDFDMAKITLVNMQQSEGIVAASKGDVAGLLGWQPNLYRLISMGGSMYATGTQLFVTGKEQVLRFSDRLQYNHSVLLASQDWIDTKPNTLIALMAAMKRATDLLTTDKPKALEAMQPVLKIDMDALKVMAEANKYALGISDSLARSLTFQSDWALSVKRIAEPVTPAQSFAPSILAATDPSLVTWKA
jgi:ABC-type nitrate/sulfonate/bicarbonate transport system substrate-binding protein